MKTTKPAFILLALVLLLTAAAVRSAEKPAKNELSNTRTASCLVKVTTEPSVLPGGIIAIDYLMHSSGVAGKATREVLEISPDEASRLFEIEEIESIYPDSAGGVDITPGNPSRTSSFYKTPTAPAASTSAARTPVPARITTTPTSRSARPTTPTRRPPTPTRPTPRRTPTVTQPLPSTTEEIFLFRLHVDFSEYEANIDDQIKPAAEEFMMALIFNLRNALSGAFGNYRLKFNQQLELARDEAARAEEKLVLMQANLRAISESRDLSLHVINRDISDLRQKLRSAKMQRASDETLYEATAERIAQEQTRRQKLAENDTITKELRSIIAVHEARLKEAQRLYDTGGSNASLADIQDIKEKILRARIELAKRQEEVSNPPGSIDISSLHDELANVAIKIKLSNQEMGSLMEQLEEAKELLIMADKYELLSLKADIAKQNLEEALLLSARLGRHARSIQQPDVTVIGAK